MPAKIVVDGIAKRLGELSVLQDVSLEVAEGETVAIVGPSGCGKSTLMGIVAGFLRPDRGGVAIDGKPDFWLSAATIEAGRIAASQYMRNEGRLYVRVFPHKSVTSIPLETRMGKGKGEPDFWAAVIKPGTVLYEIGGISEEAARLCFARLAHKMPVRVRFLKRRPA